jgi:hypothetical protein
LSKEGKIKKQENRYTRIGEDGKERKNEGKWT